LDQRPLRIGQVAWIAQVVAVIAGTIFGRPHRQRLPQNQAATLESQPIHPIQYLPGQTLTVFCRLATSSIRSNDLFGRIGGEEFACLLPVTGRREALGIAERVRAAFEAVYHTIGEHRLRATVSVGVAVADDSSLDFNTLLKQADQALGRA